MVAAAHPLTVAAGLHVLEQGGNAVDAVISAALTAGVVMPEMCGIGGDLFAIVHAPGKTGKAVTTSYLGSGIAPRGASLEHMRKHGDPDGHGGVRMPYRGSLAPGVPGMVDAAFKMLEQFGTAPSPSWPSRRSRMPSKASRSRRWERDTSPAAPTYSANTPLRPMSSWPAVRLRPQGIS